MARELVAPEVVVLLVVQELLALHPLVVKAALAARTVAVAVELDFIMRLAVMAVLAQSELFGPEQLVASHQQTQGVYK